MAEGRAAGAADAGVDAADDRTDLRRGRRGGARAARRDGRRRDRPVHPVRGGHPIWCTGAGRALLWDHPRDELARLLQDVQFVGVGGPAAARTIGEVHALLERDRTAGVISAVDEYAEGVVEFALPVFGRSGIVASIAVSGAPQSSRRTRAALTALREVGDRLSAAASGQ
ncbi:IclR family transcriptional regulator C-terminal domain-containing protein [Microbacterium sp. 13-71-7]|uniref:IclR family transcriptional regulator domain-containing protein n=1 Tax=Microbacterium sp. 13-71-7 TaxID=1970399 RepID=UPI0025EE1383|nr:IclR family transcriptional regulator C-terminal domain-containing protein [Microbacterium sp. 13-71-7]